MAIFLIACIEGIIQLFRIFYLHGQLFTIFYLHRKFSIFLETIATERLEKVSIFFTLAARGLEEHWGGYVSTIHFEMKLDVFRFW